MSRNSIARNDPAILELVTSLEPADSIPTFLADTLITSVTTPTNLAITVGVDPTDYRVVTGMMTATISGFSATFTSNSIPKDYNLSSKGVLPIIMIPIGIMVFLHTLLIFVLAKGRRFKDSEKSENLQVLDFETIAALPELPDVRTEPDWDTNTIRSLGFDDIGGHAGWLLVLSL